MDIVDMVMAPNPCMAERILKKIRPAMHRVSLIQLTFPSFKCQGNLGTNLVAFGCQRASQRLPVAALGFQMVPLSLQTAPGT